MDQVAYRIFAYEKAVEFGKLASPPPRWSPWYAAAVVAFGSTFVCSTFAGIAGVDFASTAFGQAQTITSLLAGGATFYPLWRQQKNHDTAVSARYSELLREVGDDGAPLSKNTGQHPSA